MCFAMSLISLKVMEHHISDKFPNSSPYLDQFPDSMNQYDYFFYCLGACGVRSIDVKGQGLRSEQSLILSHSCTPELFTKGWFN